MKLLRGIEQSIIAFGDVIIVLTKESVTHRVKIV